MAEISIKGNIGTKPEEKTIEIDGEQRKIVEFRMKSTEGYTDKKTTNWVDQGTWYNVTVWGSTMMSCVMEHLENGDPIYVVGQQTTDHWTDSKTKEERHSLSLRAQVVAPWLPKIASVKFVERRNANTGQKAEAEAVPA